jgi:hypothetical protein
MYLSPSSNDLLGDVSAMRLSAERSLRIVRLPCRGFAVGGFDERAIDPALVQKFAII